MRLRHCRPLRHQFAAPRVARSGGGIAVRRRFRRAQAMPDTLRPNGLQRGCATRSSQASGLPSRSSRPHSPPSPKASARQPSLASRAKAGAGGGTRTHTTLPSRDFKSLASTNSATSACLISIAFSSQAGKCFPKFIRLTLAGEISGLCQGGRKRKYVVAQKPGPAATLVIEVSDSGRIQKWNDGKREVEE